MTQNTTFNWQDGAKILLAVLTFGFGWFASNQDTMIAYTAVLIVWLLGALAQTSDKFKWLKGKGPLTVLVFLVSFVLAFLFEPFTLPLPPGWSGDVGSYFPLISVWLSSIFSIVGNSVVVAMSVYNLLLSHVLEKMPDVVSNWFK